MGGRLLFSMECFEGVRPLCCSPRYISSECVHGFERLCLANMRGEHSDNVPNSNKFKPERMQSKCVNAEQMPLGEACVVSYMRCKDIRDFYAAVPLEI